MSNLTTLFTNIANAIRSKTGSSALIRAADFPTEISNIPTDQGSTSYVVIKKTLAATIQWTFSSNTKQYLPYLRVNMSEIPFTPKLIVAKRKSEVIINTVWTDPSYTSGSYFIVSPTASAGTAISANQGIHSTYYDIPVNDSGSNVEYYVFFATF